MELNEKIIMLRKKQGYSQEDLSEKLNVSRQAISRWESGAALPDAQNILQLSKIFNVTTDYLLNDEYESDGDLPPVKNAEEALAKTVSKNLKLYLIAAIAFIVAAVSFLIVAIDQLNIVFAILTVATAGLSAFWFIQYEKGNK